MHVNVYEAKTHLSRLLQGVERGEEVVICRNGEPVARLVRYRKRPRPIGIWEGQGWIADDFTELPPDVEEAFYGDVD